MEFEKIFTDEFKKVSNENIVNKLNTDGFFSFEKALSIDFINKIEKDAIQSKLNLNINKISGVYLEKQYFFNHLLTNSKTFYNFVTSDLIIKICQKFLGEKFRLKALRYYETYGTHHMQWHTDNKTDKKFAKIPGLIFIFYVSDVDDGEFQYIKGSHNWSLESGHSDYSDVYVEKNYKDKIKSFKLSKGSLIIYNTYGIHRAKPSLNKNFIRKSVFFQIDGKIENSEPIIVNTEFIDKTDNKILMLLGFGKPSNYNLYPSTTLKTLPINNKIIFNFINYFLYRLLRKAYNLFPKVLREKVKKIIKK